MGIKDDKNGSFDRELRERMEAYAPVPDAAVWQSVSAEVAGQATSSWWASYGRFIPIILLATGIAGLSWWLLADRNAEHLANDSMRPSVSVESQLASGGHSPNRIAQVHGAGGTPTDPPALKTAIPIDNDDPVDNAGGSMPEAADPAALLSHAEAAREKQILEAMILGPNEGFIELEAEEAAVSESLVELFSTRELAVAAKRRINPFIGIKGGIARHQLGGEIPPFPDVFNFRTGDGQQVGLVFGLELSRKFSLQSGLNYSSLHQAYNAPESLARSSNPEFKTDIRLQYLEVPLLVKYHFLHKRNAKMQGHRLGLLAGIQYNRLISYEMELQGRLTEIELVDPFGINEIGLLTGLEYQWDINRRFYLTTGLELGLFNTTEQLFKVHDNNGAVPFRWQMGVHSGFGLRLFK